MVLGKTTLMNAGVPFLGHWFAMPPPPQNVSPTLSGLAGLIASMLSVVLLSFASKTAFAHP